MQVRTLPVGRCVIIRRALMPTRKSAGVQTGTPQNPLGINRPYKCAFIPIAGPQDHGNSLATNELTGTPEKTKNQGDKS
jgi:hypothetical protein